MPANTRNKALMEDTISRYSLCCAYILMTTYTVKHLIRSTNQDFWLPIALELLELNRILT